MTSTFGTQDQPSRLVLQTIRRIIRAADVHSKGLLRATGLTAPQVIILQSVLELGEVTSKKLSAHVSLSQGTVTTILDRLESKELVERYRSQRDRRVVHTKLTKKGRQMLRKAPRLLQDSFALSFDALTKTQQTSILSALQDVAEMMGAEGIDAAPVLTIETSMGD